MSDHDTGANSESGAQQVPPAPALQEELPVDGFQEALVVQSRCDQNGGDGLEAGAEVLQQGQAKCQVEDEGAATHELEAMLMGDNHDASPPQPPEDLPEVQGTFIHDSDGGTLLCEDLCNELLLLKNDELDALYRQFHHVGSQLKMSLLQSLPADHRAALLNRYLSLRGAIMEEEEQEGHWIIQQEEDIYDVNRLQLEWEDVREDMEFCATDNGSWLHALSGNPHVKPERIS